MSLDHPELHGDAEQSILGGILLDGGASLDDIAEQLRPDDFFNAKHRATYDAMLALHLRREPIDRVTLKAQLVRSGTLALVGGDNAIELLDLVTPAAANLGYYAKIIREGAILRRITLATHDIARRSAGGVEDVPAFCADAERQILEACQLTHGGAGMVPVREVMRTVYRTLEANYERGKSITGIPSGIQRLDDLTSGWQPGNLIIVAARPSLGKSALMLQLSEYAALDAPADVRGGVGIFSLEMPKEECVARLTASRARVDGVRMRNGQLIESDWSKLAKASGEIAAAGLYIDDTPAISLYDLRAKARRLQKFVVKPPLRLIVVDYLQLMSAPGIREREQQIASISRGLKSLAKELGLPIVALSQLNRGLEKRQDRRPGLSDLRESGAIEQDADLALFIHRPDMERNESVLILEKQRGGPIGDVPAIWIPPYTRFDNAA